MNKKEKMKKKKRKKGMRGGEGEEGSSVERKILNPKFALAGRVRQVTPLSRPPDRSPGPGTQSRQGEGMLEFFLSF